MNSEGVMGTETMGRVLVRAKIENTDDLVLARKWLLPAEQVRSVEVSEALVDTGATLLSMPKTLIDQLGLEPVRSRTALTSAGHVLVQIYGTARLTIEGRDCPTDVSELPDDCPVLIGQVPLELLDFVVDVPGRRLIGNPAHGGEHMIEMY
jgi:predicted aspartyl protease